MGNPSPETRRQMYAEAAKAAHQFDLLLTKIADFEPFDHPIHDTDTYLGSVFYNLDEVVAALREGAKEGAGDGE